MSDDQVAAKNERAALCDLPWAAKIDNRGPLDRETALETIRSLLGGLSPADPERSG